MTWFKWLTDNVVEALTGNLLNETIRNKDEESTNPVKVVMDSSSQNEKGKL